MPARLLHRLRVGAGHAHAWLYRRTAGRLGGRMAGRPVLLLTTTGRRTGRQRRTPLQYDVVDGDVVVAAAANGALTEPAWCRNLRTRPDVRVQIGHREVPAVAHVAAGAQRERLWARICAATPALATLEARAGREIPVVVLGRLVS
jgi:deazaflavin-dependent oxidoreductase (nitroreductase family)